MAERGPFREARCPAGVLDVDRIIELQGGRAGGQRRWRYFSSPGEQFAPLFGEQKNRFFENGEFISNGADHRHVVAGLEIGGGDEHSAPRMIEGIRQLVRAIGRVDVHQNHPDFGGCVLDHRPLGVVR